MKNSNFDNKILPLLLIISITLFTSCKKQNTDKSEEIFIGDKFYYWVSDENSTIENANQHYDDFLKLNDYTTKNLEKTLGRNGHYVWIRAEFTIPENMKNKTLGLVIPYLRFAEMSWLNESFIGSTGQFPPEAQSALYKTHYYTLSPEVINQEGTNTLLIKVWSHGQSAISSKTFIKVSDEAQRDTELSNFINVRIYLLFEGAMFLVFILYGLLFLTRKKEKEHFDFALLNFFTMFLCAPFFAPEVPFYTRNLLSYPTFMKLTISIPFYWIFYFISSFILDFEHTKKISFIEKMRLAIVCGQTAITLILPDYDTLMDMTVVMLLFSIFQLCFGLMAFFRNLFIKARRKDAVIQFLGFTPVLITILIDLGLRIHDNTKIYPFITIFGWQITIITFIIILSLRYALVYNQNERLTTHLQEEVGLRTLELQDANYELSHLNEELEAYRIRSEMDLSMASIVQKKFLLPPCNSFKGWELAICYEPLSQVSGDLYDYYTYLTTLNGISLFDVSGHGISSALITMLSKNIIAHTFQKGFTEKKSLTSMLKEINKRIIKEKGKIENYLTGIICCFGEFSEDDSIHVEMANAGHPYPLLFSAKNNKILTLLPENTQKNFGAIGMQGIEPEFSVTNFIMNIDDIFVSYTDGLTESTNENGEQFGRSRLENTIACCKNKNPEEIIKIIRSELKAFCGNKEIEDDITILILKRKSSSIVPAYIDNTIEELSSE